ncbi:MAG: hypothetical protein KBA66_12250 [Leptospiraceae bacterium]|nr:hypothetical protein [Leptospiraceae bacterium]
MTTMQLVEMKIQELNREELFFLLERVKHSLENYKLEFTSNRDKVLLSAAKLKNKNLFKEIKNPVEWQKNLRDEWRE